MKTFIVLNILLIFVVNGYVDAHRNGQAGNRIQEKHKSKTFTTTKLRKVADMSDRSDFYNNLLYPLLRVREVGTPGHTKAREHIVNFMRNLNWDVELDQFDDNTPFGVKTFTNIIATRNPDAPRRLVMACHYDSKYFQQIQFIGMTDSAVPCAMLLDIGKTLNHSLWKQRDSKGSQVSLQFIFFDGEEAFISWSKTDSLYGSRHLAEKWEKKEQLYRELPPMSQNERIDAFILLDLIGYRDPTFKNWFSTTKHLFERLKKTETRLSKENALEGIRSGSPSQYFTGGDMTGFGVEDDHIPFLSRGVPILHLIAYPFPTVWHNGNDNARNFDAASTDNLLKIFRVFIAEYLHLDP